MKTSHGNRDVFDGAPRPPGAFNVRMTPNGAGAQGHAHKRALVRAIVFENALTRAAALHTFLYAGAASLLAAALAVCIAYVINRELVRAKVGSALGFLTMAPFVSRTKQIRFLSRRPFRTQVACQHSWTPRQQGHMVPVRNPR